MLATNGPHWFDRRPENHWPGIVVSVLATAALFATAFTSMRTVAAWISERGEATEAPVLVRLTPPAVVAPSRVTPRVSEPAVAHKAPAVEQTMPSLEKPVVTPLAIEPPSPVPDSVHSRGNSAAPAIPLTPIGAPNGLADTALRARGGAPMAPAGVTIGSRTANTARFRDSVAGVRMRAIPELARTHAPTGRELAELRGSQQAAAVLQRRATTSGNSSDVHAMQGGGMGGDGAVGGAGGSPGLGGVSIPFPLFSSGPSATDRRKNEKIDADYQLRLRRLQDLLLMRRDSLRTDSLRRDSLARRP